MPDWKTHFIFSLFLVIFWILFFQFANFRLDFENLVTLIVFTIFASLFPDVDMKKSKIRDVFSLIIAVVIVALYISFYKETFMETWYYVPVYFILLYLILKYLPTKHRGVTHTFKFSVLFSLALSSAYLIFNQFFNPFVLQEFVLWPIVVFLSYSLHLVLDRT